MNHNWKLSNLKAFHKHLTLNQNLEKIEKEEKKFRKLCVANKYKFKLLHKDNKIYMNLLNHWLMY